MKATAILVVLATALAADRLAQEEPKPDYSRENLQRFAASIPSSGARAQNPLLLGRHRIAALGQRWRFAPMLPLRLRSANDE
jgi:hypothetical protein